MFKIVVLFIHVSLSEHIKPMSSLELRGLWTTTSQPSAFKPRLQAHLRPS